MKQLTIAFILLSSGVGLLLLLIFSPLSGSEETTEATVLSQILTQSLDGNRHYLVIELTDGSTHRVPADKSASCPVGSKVKIQVLSSIFSDSKTYRLDRCLNQ
ncbi:hypothetical protein [Vibrio hangzhouensis]|uniref:hypothetical protein n=1 Tax=Vibrio hangzhouensis TaxID=462991 RepID=UPI001C979868|nr:hypothetical protein [Vibrio hangzhouensis]MBY6198275.1 hypothetical protein [Vibrio hangzhouensis]